MAYLTDKELLDRFEYYTIQLEERLLEGEDFETVGEQLPFCLSLNHPETFELLHTNKVHTEITGYTTEEIREYWSEYIKIVHPDSVKSILQFLPAFYATREARQTMAFVQYVAKYQESDFSPFVSFTKPSVLPNGLILWLTIPPADFGKMSKQVEQVIKMDKFKLKHFKRFQALTNREVDVLKLLANGHNNPQIAEQLFISRQTVETHRKNIKRKLQLRSLRDLMKYAFAFNLVEV